MDVDARVGLAVDLTRHANQLHDANAAVLADLELIPANSPLIQLLTSAAAASGYMTGVADTLAHDPNDA